MTMVYWFLCFRVTLENYLSFPVLRKIVLDNPCTGDGYFAQGEGPIGTNKRLFSYLKPGKDVTMSQSGDKRVPWDWSRNR